MTENTINADETVTSPTGNQYQITQSHTTGFWYILTPVQTVDDGTNELYGEFNTRARLKYAIERFG